MPTGSLSFTTWFRGHCEREESAFRAEKELAKRTLGWTRDVGNGGALFPRWEA